MGEKNICLDIHGIKFTVSSLDKGFMALLRRNLSYFVRDGFKNSGPDINVNYHGEIPYRDIKGFSKINYNGNMICRIADVLYIEPLHNRIFLALSLKDNTLQFDVFLKNQRTALKEKAVSFITGYSPFKSAAYSQTMRLCVISAALCELCLLKGIRFSHASVISKNGKAVLLAGLPGAGKTYLTEKLVSEYGFKILSDSLCLADSDKVYPFPEMIRKDIKVDNNRLMRYSGIKIQNKFYHDIQKGYIGGISPYDKVLILAIGDKTECVPLNVSAGLKKIKDMDHSVKEIKEYDLVKLILSKIRKTDFKEDDYGFLSGKKFYDLTVKKNETDLSVIENMFGKGV